MQPQTDGDYKKLFTELIKKQVVVLGPDITYAKAKNVSGITINDQGEVISIAGDPQAILQDLINQFVELSGMIVKKTMESILTTYPGMAAVANGAMAGTVPPQQAVQQVSAQTNQQQPKPAVMGANPFSDIAKNPPAPAPSADESQGQMPKEELDTINKALSELNAQSSGAQSGGASNNGLENNSANVQQSNN